MYVGKRFECKWSKTKYTRSRNSLVHLQLSKGLCPLKELASQAGINMVEDNQSGQPQWATTESVAQGSVFPSTYEALMEIGILATDSNIEGDTLQYKHNITSLKKIH